MLAEEYALTTFVESGTHRGKTAVWAASHFDIVTTIERSAEIHEATSMSCGTVDNIEFLLGDSREVLFEVISELETPAVFWLDAHWSGGDTWGENDECPLLDEIASINQSELVHFVFIDDARLFLGPPPVPHRIEHWPAIDTVIQKLKSRTAEYYVVVIDDVILAVPDYARQLVANYCQMHRTRTQSQWVEQTGGSSIGGELRALSHGLWLTWRGLARVTKLVIQSVAGRVTRIRLIEWLFSDQARLQDG